MCSPDSRFPVGFAGELIRMPFVREVIRPRISPAWSWKPSSSTTGTETLLPPRKSTKLGWQA